MTLSKLFAIVDETKPNQYSNDIKTQWVNEVEFKNYEEVINRQLFADDVFSPFVYDLDAERELSIPDQYADVYVAYINAKIDYNNAEYDRYNNDSAMFDAAWNEYSAWIRRHNISKPIVK